MLRFGSGCRDSYAGRRGLGLARHAPVTGRDPEQIRGFARTQVLVLLTVAVLGAALGLGVFTFAYGNGAAYLSSDPAACKQCHVMNEPFDSWVKSSHRDVATCNDCHLSHDPIGKWVTKADNGFFHSLAFTTGQFPDPIRIKPRNRRVTQQACLHCHDDLLHAQRPEEASEDALLCVRCHTSPGHALR